MLSLLLSSLVWVGPPEPEGAAVPDEVPVAPDGEYVIVEAGPPSAFAPPAPRPVEFRAGAMIMSRAEFTRTRSVDSVGASTTAVPTRLRAQLEARSEHLRVLAQVQDARDIDEELDGAPRAGFHQLLFEYGDALPRGQLRVIAGRQQFELGQFHLFGIAPWGATMRSWDALRVSFEGARGRVDVFGGSLARPLLSSKLNLVEHLRSSVNLAWVLDADYEIRKALVVEGLVWGSHQRSSGEARSLVTAGLHLHGDIAPGLRYDAEGHVQAGVIDRASLRQRHLAGHAFAQLDYLSPSGFGPARARPGATLSFKYASGSACTSDEVSGMTPCTDGTNHDFDSPWMARHRWLGHADRFRQHNVIDGAAGVHVSTQPSADLALDLGISNHVFAFPQPTGRWNDTGGTLIGLDLGNQSPWAADEIDVEATLRRGWLRVDLGWLLVTNLEGGRALSGESLRQFVYVMLTIDAWSPWR